MRLISFIILAISLSACGGGNQSTAPTNIDLTGFTQNNFGDVTEAVKLDQDGEYAERGFMKNGNRNGVWMTYHPGKKRIKTMTTYIDGDMNGPHFEFSNRGQIETKVNYVNNQYHGVYATYKNGRALKEMEYDNGVLTGVYNEYDSRGKLQKETHFKNGKPHGKMIFYDEEKVIMEYEYENGEKVSGGMVQKEGE